MKVVISLLSFFLFCVCSSTIDNNVSSLNSLDIHRDPYELISIIILENLDKSDSVFLDILYHYERRNASLEKLLTKQISGLGKSLIDLFKDWGLMYSFSKFSKSPIFRTISSSINELASTNELKHIADFINALPKLRKLDGNINIVGCLLLKCYLCQPFNEKAAMRIITGLSEEERTCLGKWEIEIYGSYNELADPLINTRSAIIQALKELALPSIHRI